MKKLVITAALAALLFSCSSGPESTAEKFTESLAKGKIEEAKKYGTESTKKMLDLASAFGGLPIDPDFEFKVKKDSIVDNKAWITFTNQKGEEDVIELVKIDGKWLVHMEAKK